MISPMKRWPKTLVAEKLASILAVLVFSLVISDFIAYRQIELLRNRLNRLVDNFAQRQLIASLIQQDLLRLHRAEKNVILSNGKEYIYKYKDNMNKYINSIKLNINKLEYNVSPEEKNDIADFKSIFSKWEKIDIIETSLKLKGKENEAISLSAGWSRIIFDKLASKLDLIISRGNYSMTQEIVNSGINIQRTKMSLIGIFVFIIIIFVSTVAYLIRSITMPLLRLKEAAVKFAGGKLEDTIEIKTGDEIEVLANAFNSMVSQLNEKIQHIETQNNNLKELNALKNHFVSVVSHEFKSPLGIIRESQNIILDGLVGDITVKQKELLEAGRRTTDRLIRLTRDLLDIARIESGKIQLKLEPVELAKLIQESVSQFEQEMQKKGIRIRITLDGTIGAIWVDQDKMMQVIINLLSNAVKYTPSGGEILISLQSYEREVRFEIADSGPGIKDKDKEKIFDKFERVTAENQEGTGLGLPIAKEIVLLHKGSIWVESKPGHGSTFIFTIPRYLGSVQHN